MGNRKLFGIRGRIESLTMLTGEPSENVRVGVYGANQGIDFICGSVVAEGLHLGDEVQVWVELVKPAKERPDAV